MDVTHVTCQSVTYVCLYTVRWYTKAADQGNAEAQFDLAKCYEFGNGCEKNFDQAFKWYTKAADQGNIEAQSVLIRCYELGNGSEPLEQSFEYVKKLADQGNAEAQYEVARGYEEGRGCEANQIVAVEWYEKAAANRNGKAIEKCKQLSRAKRVGLFVKTLGFHPPVGFISIDMQPKKGCVYTYVPTDDFRLKITQFISAKNAGLAETIANKLTKNTDDSTAVIVRSITENYDSKYFYIKILDDRHDYVDGDVLESGFYKYVGVENFENSRIRAFEEVFIPKEFEDVISQ